MVNRHLTATREPSPAWKGSRLPRGSGSAPRGPPRGKASRLEEPGVLRGAGAGRPQRLPAAWEKKDGSEPGSRNKGPAPGASGKPAGGRRGHSGERTPHSPTAHPAGRQATTSLTQPARSPPGLSWNPSRFLGHRTHSPDVTSWAPRTHLWPPAPPRPSGGRQPGLLWTVRSGRSIAFLPWRGSALGLTMSGLGRCTHVCACVCDFPSDFCLASTFCKVFGV